MNEDKADRRRRRGAWLGLLLGLALALAGVGYALSSSPSVPTKAGKPSASPSSQVLAPSTGQTAAPGATSTSQVVLAPAASTRSGNGNGAGNGNGNCLDPASESSSCQHSFGVTVGQAPLLYPGVARSLPVTFANPNNFDIYVTTYRVTVAVPASKASACPASSLEVPSGTVTLSPRLTVPKNRSVSTTVLIKLGADAPEGCQQVPFAITVNASAVKK